MDHYAIIGMQFGSEAKGALAGYLALKREPDVIMCNWSPNAGHTFVDGQTKIVRRCLPIGTISPGCEWVLIGPGAIIDPNILLHEMSTIKRSINVCIHPHAAIVRSHHSVLEQSYRRIGSTKKGAAAAAIERMHRDTDGQANIALYCEELLNHPHITINVDIYHHAMKNARLIQVEGCQGYSLSMYNGMYPYTTSRDTTIHQLKADIAWHGALSLSTYGALRTYPIRVAGTSGETYGDARETTWDVLGVTPEITTVTKKERRVFTFSMEQILEAQKINDCEAFYLSFCDYYDENDKELSMLIDMIINVTDVPIMWQSYGPDFKDMVEYG